MGKLLSTINSPEDLQGMKHAQLTQLATEIREVLCRLLGTRSAHFASNLGAVEICLALHTTFDFAHDRLVWDTGHQIYPHKLVTGRYEQFDTIRTKGGLMGYPHPDESPYDLFMTGHAGCSLSSALGLQLADQILRPEEDRHAVAVIGDGAFASGVVFEALNHGGWLKSKNFIVVLNDNQMSICPRVGGLGNALDRVRMTSAYTGFKAELQKLLKGLPLLGGSTERFFFQIKEALKAGLVGGMLFEEVGFNYIGPVDGHNIAKLQKYLRMAKDFDGPVVLHAVTQKGHGFKPAQEDPTTYHAPAPFFRENGQAIPHSKQESGPSYTRLASDGILHLMRQDSRICVITAAMCQGNMLEAVRDEFPERFFDVSICESHAVALASGMAKAGMRPIVDIYSTFMQRSYDQIFQEVSLQNLPVILLLDRAGLVGPDGQTHHGVFDLCYLRPFPNLEVLTPGDAADMESMLPYAVECNRPVALRYPKCAAMRIDRPANAIKSGRCEIVRQGDDGLLLAAGSLLDNCVTIADTLAEEGVDLGVINARFVKPLDTDTILPIIQKSPFVVTVEEGMLAGGFGSAVLEAACDARVNTAKIKRLGIGDRYIDHGTRTEQLADVGLDTESILHECRLMHQWAKQCEVG